MLLAAIHGSRCGLYSIAASRLETNCNCDSSVRSVASDLRAGSRFSSI